MESRDLTPSSPSSTATTELEDGGLTITVAMAKEAAMHYQSGNFDECLELLHQLLEQKPNDPKVMKFISPFCFVAFDTDRSDVVFLICKKCSMLVVFF